MRSPNARPREQHPTTTLELTAAAFGQLKHNQPGPSGKIGGYGQFENALLIHGNEDARSIPGRAYFLALDDPTMGRLVRYVMRYEGGGPNGRIRRAFCGAFAEAFAQILRDQS